MPLASTKMLHMSSATLQQHGVANVTGHQRSACFTIPHWAPFFEKQWLMERHPIQAFPQIMTITKRYNNYAATSMIAYYESGQIYYYASTIG